MNDQADSLRKLRSPLGKVQGPSINAEGAKRYGWFCHAILVVGMDDPRLTPVERDFLSTIGEKIYGRRACEREAFHAG